MEQPGDTTSASGGGRAEDLPTEALLDGARALEALDARAFVALANRENARVAPAVAAVEADVAAAIDAIAARFTVGGRLVYVGAGTSGRLGVLDASECPPTFGTAPDRVVGLIAGGDRALRCAVEGAEDDELAAVADLDALAPGPRDAVVGLSASGRTPYVRRALEHAAARGALTVAVVCNPGSAVAAAAELAIEAVVGPEVVAGSTRLKAGTAQKLVLNLLSTGVLVRTGHTLGGRMKNLRASNAKLRERAARILADAARLDLDAARARLDEHGGSLPDALRAAGVDAGR